MLPLIIDLMSHPIANFHFIARKSNWEIFQCLKYLIISYLSDCKQQAFENKNLKQMRIEKH